jgi:hypothetical protein
VADPMRHSSQYFVSCLRYLLRVRGLTPLKRLSASTGKPLSSTVYSLASRPAHGGAIEAPVLFKDGGYYYLFTSWDKCCAGTSSTYNIRVGRATRCDRLLCSSVLITYTTPFSHNHTVYQCDRTVYGSVWCCITWWWGYVMRH